MKIATALLWLAGASAFQTIAAYQSPANVAGNWDITVRMPAGPVSEHWTIQQKGTTVTGMAKGERGELPVSGTIEGAFFRVTVRDGEKEYKVRATVDGAAMDGSITLGVGDAHLWFAKRSTVTKRTGNK
jgi:hypothetical protein